MCIGEDAAVFCGHGAAAWLDRPPGNGVAQKVARDKCAAELAGQGVFQVDPTKWQYCQRKVRRRSRRCHDTWCGPTDLCVGPDGAHLRQRLLRPAHGASRIPTQTGTARTAASTRSPRRCKTAEAHRFGELSSNELVDLLSNSNHWYANRARVELAHRRDPSVVDRLRKMATQTADDRLALEGLWALNATAGIDDQLALATAQASLSLCPLWTIRILGDRKALAQSRRNSWPHWRLNEPSPIVRGQLAATAKRLPGSDCLRIVESLLRSQPHESDPRVPWLIWWAVESKAMTDTKLIAQRFSRPSMWAKPAGPRNSFAADSSIRSGRHGRRLRRLRKLLCTAQPEYADSTNEYLRKGLAERTDGLQGIGQGGLSGDQAAGTEARPDHRSPPFRTADARA